MAPINSKTIDGFNLKKTANKEFIDAKSHSFVSDNRYSPLRDLQDNRTEFNSNEAFNSRRNSIANSRNVTQIDDTSAPNKQVKKQARNSVVIVGDSIIKQVDQRKMSSNKTVKVRSFPGATIEDMALLETLTEK